MGRLFGIDGWLGHGQAIVTRSGFQPGVVSNDQICIHEHCSGEMNCLETSQCLRAASGTDLVPRAIGS
jgi:hypothetical protein